MSSGKRPAAPIGEHYAASMVAKQQTRIAKAQAGQRRAAIEIHCMDCQHVDTAGLAVKCENRGCILWPHAFSRAKRAGA